MATTLEMPPDTHPPLTQCWQSFCAVPGSVLGNQGQVQRELWGGREPWDLGWAEKAWWGQIYITLSTNIKVSAIYAPTLSFSYPHTRLTQVE